jgi:hypothetical protein
MLDFVVLRDVPILEPDGSGEFTRDVWDYRDTHPGGIDHQKAFNGWDLEVTSPFDDVELGLRGEGASLSHRR